MGSLLLLSGGTRSSFVWICRRHSDQARAKGHPILKSRTCTLVIMPRRTSRTTELERNQREEMSGAHTSKDKLPGLHLGSTACSLTSSIILSPVPCSRSPWSQRFHWFPGRSFLQGMGLQSRAIVWSRAIAARLGMAVRRPHGLMDVVGSCRRKDEKPKDIRPNGGEGCLGFSDDQARGVSAYRATWSSREVQSLSRGSQNHCDGIFP